MFMSSQKIQQQAQVVSEDYEMEHDPMAAQMATQMAASLFQVKATI